MMARVLFSAAFAVGAMVILWMSWVFANSDTFALLITVMIGATYLVGFTELFQFRRSTASLAQALNKARSEQTLDFDAWLKNLPDSLKNPVRLRIEGEKIGMPAPALTPFLTGLLVMLGLLGTFVGMVDTLKGAVVALEGSTELQAIREGLAAPIKGLGLAFGTSVAGVAGSAVLGLVSALCRRERLLVVRDLDTQVPTTFRQFSLVYSQQEAFTTLQSQVNALPEVASKLADVSNKLESMGEGLSERLLHNQSDFHQSAQTVYGQLAESVGQSLRDAISESGRLTGESITPIVQDVMQQISSEIRSGAAQTHTQLSATTEAQLANISDSLNAAVTTIEEKLSDGVAQHQSVSLSTLTAIESTSSRLGDRAETQLTHISEHLRQTVSDVNDTLQQGLERQSLASQSALENVEEVATRITDNAQRQMATVSERFDTSVVSISDKLSQSLTQQQSLNGAALEKLEKLTVDLSEQFSGRSETALKAYESSSRELLENVSSKTDVAAQTMVGEIGRLLNASEELVNTRIEGEAKWVEGQQQRLDAFTSSLQQELQALCALEEQRSDAAVGRLAELQTAVTEHLGQLGSALEEPMSRLIETASETPRAAAEVIGHLRTEISKNIERDNSLLEERQKIMQELSSLSSAMEQASLAQNSAAELLVNSSTEMLEKVSGRFSEKIETEVGRITEIVDHFSGSATEMSSLGDAFGVAVNVFNDSNQGLIENLNRIEEALEKSNTRSDEQLGYYVAQAREIIDHSMMSQKEVFEEIRKLSRAAEAEAV